MADSIYWQLLSAVKSQLNLIPGIPPIKLRKKPRLFKSDPPTVCIVTPGKGGEKIVKKAFDSTVVYRYPVFVAIVAPGNLIEENALNLELNLREKVRNTLFQAPTFSGLANVYTLTIDPDEAAAMGEELGTQLQVDSFLVQYDSVEQRLS